MSASAGAPGSSLKFWRGEAMPCTQLLVRRVLKPRNPAFCWVERWGDNIGKMKLSEEGVLKKRGMQAEGAGEGMDKGVCWE